MELIKFNNLLVPKPSHKSNPFLLISFNLTTDGNFIFSLSFEINTHT